MLKRIIHITSGMPASGKSTYVAAHALKSDIVLHRDEFRAELRSELNSTEYFPTTPREEWILWTNYINCAITSSFCPVWIDQTTNTATALCRLLKSLSLAQNDSIIVDVFRTPIDDCLAANSPREVGRVPEETIRSMFAASQKNPITDETISKLQKEYDISVEYHIKQK